MTTYMGNGCSLGCRDVFDGDGVAFSHRTSWVGSGMELCQFRFSYLLLHWPALTQTKTDSPTVSRRVSAMYALHNWTNCLPVRRLHALGTGKGTTAILFQA